MADVEISKKFLVFCVFFFLLYIYLYDRFSKKEYQDWAQNMIKPAMGNSTHTMFDLMKNETNFFSAAVSSVVCSLLYNLPVFKHFYNI